MLNNKLFKLINFLQQKAAKIDVFTYFLQKKELDLMFHTFCFFFSFKIVQNGK